MASILMNICACGCGKESKKRCLQGHHNRVNFVPWNKGKIYALPRNKKIATYCKCGCNNFCTPGKSYIIGHNRRNKTLSETNKLNIRNGVNNYLIRTGKQKKIEDYKICSCGCGQRCRGRFIVKHKPEKTIKFCECGCGGIVKNRFVEGHHLAQRKGHHYLQKTIEKAKKIRVSHVQVLHPYWSLEQIEFYLLHKNELNLCECGCKQLCNNRFVSGHNFRGLTKETCMNILTRSNSYKDTYKRNGDSIIAKRMKNSGLKKFSYIFSNGPIKKMRSSWEVSYAQYLDSLNIKWQYEPKQFKLSNGKRYWPDFYLPDLNEWHEIKGFMSKIAQEKLDLFAKDYPSEKLVVLRDIPKYIKNKGNL